MVRRLLVLTAVAVAFVAAPATQASAQVEVPCVDHPCISICWDCLDGPYVNCWYVQDVGLVCV